MSASITNWNQIILLHRKFHLIWVLLLSFLDLSIIFKVKFFVEIPALRKIIFSGFLFSIIFCFYIKQPLSEISRTYFMIKNEFTVKTWNNFFLRSCKPSVLYRYIICAICFSNNEQTGWLKYYNNLKLVSRFS